MQILLCAPTPYAIWDEHLRRLGHRVLLPDARPATTADLCLAVVAAPLRARAVLTTLALPLLLVTPALAQARVLAPHLPLLRLISHPTRALHALGDLLAMSSEMPGDTGAPPPIFDALVRPWDAIPR